MDFLERAKQTINKGVPVIRLQPHSKRAMDDNWPTLATRDLATLEKWNQETPNANCGAVALAELGGTFFFEVDSPEVIKRIESETNQKIPPHVSGQFAPGQRSCYFRQSKKSLALGNVAQGYVRGGDFSVRVDNQYVVVASFSLHPITGAPYEVVSDCEIAEAPDWLIDWIRNQKLGAKGSGEVPRDENGNIPHGYIHDQLVIQCGKLAHMGMPTDGIEGALLSWAHANCAPPLDDNKIIQVARSTGKWERGNPMAETVLVNGRPIGLPKLAIVSEPEDAIEIKPLPYPTFPEWVMQGTSIYNGLVKPFCDINSRIPEFMFMPAMTILLNYLGTKVRIESRNFSPSIFLAMIGRRGETHKSSSISDAITYFENMGVAAHFDPSMSNANARSLVFTPASPEGLGKEMQRSNCKNGILLFDELSALASKAGIESSNLSSTLLTIYESGKFQNLVKSSKDSYSIAPGTYCASMIVCSTDKNFRTHWSKLAGASSGLTDRFYFLYQPKVFKEKEIYTHVYTQEASVITRQLIDKAISQASYRIEDHSKLLKKFLQDNENSGRTEIRAEKFALAFAVDLGLEIVDDEAIERGLALVEYEMKVKRYLRMYEASTKEGGLQLEIITLLQQNDGIVSLRELHRALHPERIGTGMWDKVYRGLIGSGWCREEGDGNKSSPKILRLLRTPEDDD